MELPGGLPADVFLRDYWQKKPLVIRQAFPGIISPVSSDELAGLACEEAVESRIVIENERGKPWQLHNGPFPPERFEELPATHWTLLVQGLDHWVPEAADLLEAFRFVPNWRLDDIMASYAPAGGSVGPHFDQYDVFLLQAEGHRRWQFGGQCDEASPRVDGTPLRILKDWQGDESTTLAPGDMLYLPPGVGHHGIAEDDCITLSIGFRAPSIDDILTGYTDFLCGQATASVPLSDPALQCPENPGAIDQRTIERLQQVIVQQLGDTQQLALWFGQFSTAPKNANIVVPPEAPITPEALAAEIDAGATLRWNEGSRYAFYSFDHETALFVDGERYMLRGDAQGLAPTLCRGNRIATVDVLELITDSALLGLLTNLFNQGNLTLE
ncbi:cupin domain-containing protein [Marinobacter caseinilyticus]|uniref:cupin domain-containing protein n=1 Tax=Marinobacter caseinilyticus TaxID=2692195 RepID=UPI00140DAF83|nr:cupin domain-containing protein [Marinobacter caseinilyticus]